MHRMLALAIGLFLPTQAFALGVGTTYAPGNLLAGLGGLVPGNQFYLATSMGFLPSLDLHPGNTTVQIHALETVQALTNENLWLGANVYFNVAQVANTGSVIGVVEPGFGIDLQVVDGFYTIITGECRFGAMLPGESSLGIYAVPALGVQADENDVDLVIAATLQLSVWFGS